MAQQINSNNNQVKFRYGTQRKFSETEFTLQNSMSQFREFNSLKGRRNKSFSLDNEVRVSTEPDQDHVPKLESKSNQSLEIIDKN